MAADATGWRYRPVLSTRRFATNHVHSQRVLVRMATTVPGLRAEAASDANCLLWFRKGALVVSYAKSQIVSCMFRNLMCCTVSL